MPARSIAFFAHDSSESTVKKRVAAFQANGSHVVGFMFKRVRGKPASPPAWHNVDLGTTIDRNYLKRLSKLLAAAFKLLKYRDILKRCQIYYARNIDMLLLAILAKRVSGSPAVVAYEVLDVQRVFVGEGMISKALRWAERYLLARSDMLIVSSPEFVSRYFLPYQGYSGPWHLLENKVFATAQLLQEAKSGIEIPAGPPWTIGWFGTLRCVRSLEILCRIADEVGDRVAIHVRGLPSSEDLPVPVIEAACNGRANVIYGGPFASPRDLPAIYGKVHLAWCIDYLDAGFNSDWLLPNRLYEGGLMGVPAMAREPTATSLMVAQKDWGWVFAEPLELTVAEFIKQLDAATYQRKRRGLESMQRSTFVDLTDTGDLLRRLDDLAAFSPRR